MTAALLVTSGGSKLRDPEPTRGALRAASLPSTGWAVAALGVVEVAVGVAALATSTITAAVGVAVLYLGFGGFVVVALRTGLPLQSCGCFGRSDTPPGRGHVIVNFLAAGSATAVALRGGADLAATIADQPAAGLPYLAFLVMGMVLLGLILTDLPALTARSTA